MSPCWGSSCMHFTRQKITQVLLAPLEMVPHPNPCDVTEQIHGGKEGFLAWNNWGGFAITTAALNIIFQGQVKISS